MKKNPKKEVEEFDIFKRNIDQSISEKPIGEIVTKGKIISEITRDDSNMLIVAKFIYKASDAKALFFEVTEYAFESFISSIMDERFYKLNLGSKGWFGKPISKELIYSSEKIEFMQLHNRLLD